MGVLAFTTSIPTRFLAVQRVHCRNVIRCATQLPDGGGGGGEMSATIAPTRPVLRVPSSAAPERDSESLDGVSDVTKMENAVLETKEEEEKGALDLRRILGYTATACAVLALGAGMLHTGDRISIPVSLEMPSQPTDGLLGAITEFIEGPRFLVSMGMGVSAFVQALTGFGFAVVSIGALNQLDWIVHSSVFDTVQPVVATLGAITAWALLLPEVSRVRWDRVRTLLLATTVATPLGALALEFVDAALVIRALGALITGYVAYSVLGVDVPKRLGGNAGAWALGLIAGALGGAFDLTGPPLVIHGEAADWDTANGDFRRNVLAVVSVNSTLVVVWDFFSGRLHDFYYFDFLKYAAPSVLVGLLAGNYLSTKLDPAAFKKIVLATCALLGAKLLLS